MKAPRAKSLFITLEGGEGAGKSCLAAFLKEGLTRLGHVCLLTRQPGGTPLGEDLRSIALTRDCDPKTRLGIILACCAEQVATLILPALKAGHVVICDRFCDSTVVYQGYGQGMDTAAIKSACDLFSSGLTPDLTLLLDLDPQVGLGRVKDPNYFESLGLDFHKSIREGFLTVASQEQDRYRIIDAQKPFEEVAKEAIACIQEMFSSKA